MLSACSSKISCWQHASLGQPPPCSPPCRSQAVHPPVQVCQAVPNRQAGAAVGDRDLAARHPLRIAAALQQHPCGLGGQACEVQGTPPVTEQQVRARWAQLLHAVVCLQQWRGSGGMVSSGWWGRAQGTAVRARGLLLYRVPELRCWHAYSQSQHPASSCSTSLQPRQTPCTPTSQSTRAL